MNKSGLREQALNALHVEREQRQVEIDAQKARKQAETIKLTYSLLASRLGIGTDEFQGDFKAVEGDGAIWIDGIRFEGKEEYPLGVAFLHLLEASMPCPAVNCHSRVSSFDLKDMSDLGEFLEGVWTDHKHSFDQEQE